MRDDERLAMEKLVDKGRLMLKCADALCVNKLIVEIGNGVTVWVDEDRHVWVSGAGSGDRDMTLWVVGGVEAA